MPYKSTLKPQGQRLAGPYGQSIPCWGECKKDLIFNSRHFAWAFLLADVQFPIINVDFLRHFRLLVNITAGRLVDTASSQSFPIISESSDAAGRCTNIAPPFQELLRRFPEVVNPDKRLPLVTKHKVEHHIRVKDGPPITAKFRRLDAEKLVAAKAEFDQLEGDGIIRKSYSPWASPLHMVRKPLGSWRPCGDYRRINLVTIPDSYPLPNMMAFAAKMSGCHIFSKVDLRKGYHQIPMHARDIAMTAIITSFGLYEFLKMGFMLHNTATLSRE
jgi:hypothetical protein